MIQADMMRSALHDNDPDTRAFAGFHTPRRTFISRVASADPRTAQELADHSCLNTPAQDMHTSRAHQTQAIEAMLEAAASPAEPTSTSTLTPARAGDSDLQSQPSQPDKTVGWP